MGRETMRTVDRVSQLRKALGVSHIDSNTKFHSETLSRANRAMLSRVRGLVGGQIDDVSAALDDLAAEAPETGPDEIVNQAIGRHGLQHLYGPPKNGSVLQLISGFGPRNDQIQFASALQSHGLWKRDVVSADGVVVVRGDPFAATIRATVDTYGPVTEASLDGFVFSLLIAAYSRFPPFAAGVMNWKCATPLEVLDRLLSETDPRASLVGPRGPFGRKSKSHTYDLNTFTLSKFVLPALTKYREHDHRPRLVHIGDEWLVRIPKSLVAITLGPLLTNHSATEEGYVQGIGRVELTGEDVEVATSSSKSAKANVYARAFGVDNWESESRRVVAAFGSRRLRTGSLDQQLAVEQSVSGSWVQSASCKTAQRLVAQYNAANLGRVRRACLYQIPQKWVFTVAAKSNGRGRKDFGSGPAASSPVVKAKAKAKTKSATKANPVVKAKERPRQRQGRVKQLRKSRGCAAG